MTINIKQLKQVANMPLEAREKWLEGFQFALNVVNSHNDERSVAALLVCADVVSEFTPTTNQPYLAPRKMPPGPAFKGKSALENVLCPEHRGGLRISASLIPEWLNEEVAKAIIAGEAELDKRVIGVMNRFPTLKEFLSAKEFNMMDMKNCGHRTAIRVAVVQKAIRRSMRGV
jgi:hypothetical protein